MRLPKLRAPWLRVSEGQMQMKSLGRLPRDVAQADAVKDPEPEYIAEAVPASDEAWAREQARRRARLDPEQRDGQDTSDDRR